MVRSLLPSAISSTLCICFSVVVVVLHLLLLSFSTGTSLPKLFDGQWGLEYTDYIVGPVERVMNNMAVNNVLVVVLWGFVGLCTYGLIDYCVQLSRDWRHAEHDVEVSGSGYGYVAHPLRRTFVISLLWRLGIVIVAVMAFVFAQPLIQQAFRAGPDIILGSISPADTARELALELAVWAFLAHWCVVLLRLFLMRTRIFGDPEIA